MRTETIDLYTFAELGDAAKEKAREWWRSYAEFSWMDESQNSINAFCSHFGVRLTQWNVAPYQTPDYSAEYFNSHFRGLKLKDFDRNHMPTGYCLDCDLWITFYDEFKATGSAKKAFDSALDSGFMAWRNEMEHQLSNEYIDETITINEYHFFENGRPF